MEGIIHIFRMLLQVYNYCVKYAHSLGVLLQRGMNSFVCFHIFKVSRSSADGRQEFLVRVKVLLFLKYI